MMFCCKLCERERVNQTPTIVKAKANDNAKSKRPKLPESVRSMLIKGQKKELAVYSLFLSFEWVIANGFDCDCTFVLFWWKKRKEMLWCLDNIENAYK